MLSLLDFTNNRLVKYDFSKRTLKSVSNLVPVSFATEFRKPAKVHVLFAQPLAGDSFVLALNPVYLNLGVKMNDFAMIYNSKTNQASYFTSENYPGPTVQNPFFPRYNSLTPRFSRTNMIDRKRNRWILNFGPWIGVVPGDSLFEAQNYEMAGYYDLNDPDKPLTMLPIHAPKHTGDGYYPKDFAKLKAAVTHDHKYLFGFPYLNQCYLYNPDNGKVDTVALGSSIVESIPASRVPYENKPNAAYPKAYPWDDLSLPQYSMIYYDEYRYRYYRLLRHPSGSSGAAYTLVIADTNFQVIGETLLPEELTPPFERFSVFCAPDGVYFWNPAKTSAYANSYVFTRLNFKPTSKPAARELRKALAARAEANKPAGKGLADYLSQKHKLEPQNDALLLVPVDNSCASCEDNVLKYFADSVFAAGNDGPRLVLIAANPSEIENALHKHGLEPYRDRILTDPKRQFLRYAEDWINPRWLVFKDGAQTEDVILNPDQIPGLPDRVRQWRKAR